MISQQVQGQVAEAVSREALPVEFRDFTREIRWVTVCADTENRAGKQRRKREKENKEGKERMQTEEENRRKSFKKPKKELHVICQVDYR